MIDTFSDVVMFLKIIKDYTTFFNDVVWIRAIIRVAQHAAAALGSQKKREENLHKKGGKNTCDWNSKRFLFSCPFFLKAQFNRRSNCAFKLLSVVLSWVECVCVWAHDIKYHGSTTTSIISIMITTKTIIIRIRELFFHLHSTDIDLTFVYNNVTHLLYAAIKAYIRSRFTKNNILLVLVVVSINVMRPSLKAAVQQQHI